MTAIKKVLFLSNHYFKNNQGGAELQMIYLAEGLAKNGYEVDFLFLDKNKETRSDDVFTLHSIKRFKYIERVFGDYCYYHQALNKIKEIKPDIIYHRNLGALALPIFHYSKRHNCKTILHIAHQMDVSINIDLSRKVLSDVMNLYLRKYLIKRFGKIVAQAKYQAKLLKKNFNRETDLIMPNIHPIAQNKIIKQDKLVVLWIANLKPWKQPQVFIDLAKECQDLDVEFVMIGRDNLGRESKFIMEKINRSENLSYLGELPLPEVNKFFRKSHIFVNTSLQEGFPNTFIQAWLREVPVVSLNVDPDNVLVENEIGFHSKTFQQLVEDIDLLVKDGALRESIARRAKKYAEKEHSFLNLDAFIRLIEPVK